MRPKHSRSFVGEASQDESSAGKALNAAAQEKGSRAVLTFFIAWVSYLPECKSFTRRTSNKAAQCTVDVSRRDLCYQLRRLL